MHISDEALDEFIEIYKAEFGDDISRSEASEMASRLIKLYKLLSTKPSAKKYSSQATTHSTDDHPPIGFRT